jgi:hypothetical protein
MTVQTLGPASQPGQYPLVGRYVYALRSGTWTGPALVQASGPLFVDPARWLVATGSSVLESTDAGESWHALGRVPAGWLVDAMTMVDRDHGWAVLFSSPTVNGQPTASGLSRTADGGRTWTLVGLPS